MEARSPRHGTLRVLAGLALLGQGVLILLGVVAHEARVVGAASLLLGAGLLAWGLPPLHLRRAGLVALLGGIAVAGTLGYNALAGSDLSLPEWGLLGYGVALLAAAPFLGRKVGRAEVGTLVGWSFPVALAPLALFALNAVVASERASAATPVIEWLLVRPLALCLGLLGTPAAVVGNNVIVPTERGTLSLGVGLVCAGLYPMVLFLGVLGLHAWRTGPPKHRLALYLGVGLLGLYLANLVRLVTLAEVGRVYGGAALQTAHAHLGWVLFAGFMLLYWGVLMRKLEPAGPGKPKAPAA